MLFIDGFVTNKIFYVIDINFEDNFCNVLVNTVSINTFDLVKYKI